MDNARVPAGWPPGLRLLPFRNRGPDRRRASRKIGSHRRIPLPLRDGSAAECSWLATNSSLYVLPGGSESGIPLHLRRPAVELLSLFLGQREGIRIRLKALPEMFHEFTTVRRRQG